MALKILLADDSMTAQNMGKKILSEAGYEVIAVSNGAAAVKKIAEHKPDLAVLDVYMPGYTGLEVCERVKNALETSKMPVLLSVGKMEPFKPEEGNRVKADGLLIKPFEASELVAAVQKLITKTKAATGTVMITAGDPHAAPGYVPTVKMQAPEDFKDETYESWKSHAPEHVEASMPATQPVSFPTEMQAAPALGLDHFGESGEAARPSSKVEAPPTGMLHAPTTELAPKNVLAPAAGLPAQAAAEPPQGWFGAAASHTPAAPADEEAENLETLSPVSPSLPVMDDVALPAEAVQKPHPQDSSAEETARFQAVQTYGASASAGGTPVPEEQQQTLKAASAAAKASPSADMTAQLMQPTASAEAPNVPHIADPNLEITSARYDHPVEAGTAPGLEPNIHEPSQNEASGETEPGLMTDVSEMAEAFPTRFGVADAEPLTVGVAADLPELYAEAEKAVSDATKEKGDAKPDADDAQPLLAVSPEEASAAGMPQPAGAKNIFKSFQPPAQGLPVDEIEEPVSPAPAAWRAFETSLNIHEKSVSLHEEMQKQFVSSHNAATGPATQPEKETGAPASFENAPDPQLAKAMAAAVGAEMAPVFTEAVSESSAANPSLDMEHNEKLIADIVHRVTERMKPHLTAEIARELAMEIAKKKK